MSARDRKILEELVSDCVLYNLHENESLEYIRKRAVGIPISRSNFYSIKKRISGNESERINERLTEHTKVGFALNHFKHIESIENVQKILFQTLADEHSKPAEKKNLFAIARLATNVLQNTQILRQLNLDTPYVSNLKAAIDEWKEYRRLVEQKNVQEVVRDYPESALVIDPNSIVGKKLDTPDGLPWGDKPVF